MYRVSKQVVNWKQRTKVLWAMLGLILFGTALRWGNLGAQPLWFDELYTLRLATNRGGIGTIWANAAQDLHPPLYTLLQRGVLTFLPATEFTVRWLSAVAGVFALAVLARYLLDIAGPGPAHVGTLLLAVSPFHLYYSQEARSYAFSVALLLLAALVFRRAVATRRPRLWLAHGLCLTILAYTHYFNLFIIGAEFVYLVGLTMRQQCPRQAWKGFLANVLLIGIALLPLAPAFLHASQVNPVTGRTTTHISLVSSLKALVGGESRYGHPVWQLVGAVVLIVLVTVGQTIGIQQLLLDTAAVGLPLLFVFTLLPAAGYTVPSYEERQFLAVLPFAITLVTAGVTALWNRKSAWSKSIVLIAIAALLLSSFNGVYRYNSNFLKNQDFALVQYLHQAAQPGDLVLCNTYSAETTFAFYGDAQMMYWGKPQPDDGNWIFSSQIGLSFDEEVYWTNTWEDLMAQPRIWLIYLPGQGPAILTERLLAERSVLEQQTLGPFQVYLLGQ